jgi:acylpyruvate hydrolase
MRLVTFSDDKGVRVGVHDPETNEIVDLSASTRLPKEMTAFVALGKKGLSRARRAVKSGEGRVPFAGVKLLAPFPRPAKNILCVGKNYHEHAREFHASGVDATGKETIPEVPIMFTKWPNSVIGPGAPIPSANDYTDTVDYEGELAVVIGEGGRHIEKKEAYKHVYGYTIVNDVTARDRQVTLRPDGSSVYNLGPGKNFDTCAPIGPAIVTADEIADPQNLQLRTWVNDELRQSNSTVKMIWTCAQLVAFFSTFLTLRPGVVISTGTPGGTAWGTDPELGGKKPMRKDVVGARGYLQAGDVVTCEIEAVGRLVNRVAAA